MRKLLSKFRDFKLSLLCKGVFIGLMFLTASTLSSCANFNLSTNFRSSTIPVSQMAFMLDTHVQITIYGEKDKSIADTFINEALKLCAKYEAIDRKSTRLNSSH